MVGWGPAWASRKPTQGEGGLFAPTKCTFWLTAQPSGGQRTRGPLPGQPGLRPGSWLPASASAHLITLGTHRVASNLLIRGNPLPLGECPGWGCPVSLTPGVHFSQEAMWAQTAGGQGQGRGWQVASPCQQPHVTQCPFPGRLWFVPGPFSFVLCGETEQKTTPGAGPGDKEVFILFCPISRTAPVCTQARGCQEPPTSPGGSSPKRGSPPSAGQGGSWDRALGAREPPPPNRHREDNILGGAEGQAAAEGHR